jgi:hypothetical protein
MTPAPSAERSEVMFKWRKRDGSKRWILGNENFPYLASFGRWNNPDENQDNWRVNMPNGEFFLTGKLTEEEVKRYIQGRTIGLLFDSIREIESL